MTLNGFASGLKYVLVASALFLVSLASCANAGAPSAVPARAPDEAGEPVCLTNIKWVLKTLNGRESAGEPFTLSFFEDGYLEGEAVCNSYGANYASGDGFRLSGELNKTNLECGATTTARQDEAAFLEIMSEADCLDARHGRLKIEDSAGDRTLSSSPDRPRPRTSHSTARSGCSFPCTATPHQGHSCHQRVRWRGRARSCGLQPLRSAVREGRRRREDPAARHDGRRLSRRPRAPGGSLCRSPRGVRGVRVTWEPAGGPRRRRRDVSGLQKKGSAGRQLRGIRPAEAKRGDGGRSLQPQSFGPARRGLR